MSSGISCSHPKCFIAETGHCFLNSDPVTSCNSYIDNTEKKKERKTKKDNETTVFWTGEYFSDADIERVSQSGSPLIIGVVGTAKAAKTSYLGMLYTLLLNGHFLSDHFFSGSKTLTAWEKLAFALRFHQGSVYFPEATPSNPDFYSIYHLSLQKQNKYPKELFFADASGEVFSQWGINRSEKNAGSARWIHHNSNAFILFIDCIALIEKKAEAKENILDIATQLKHNLGERRVAIVWSKADKIEEVRPNIRASLQEELKNIFGVQSSEFEISNYSTKDPDLKCHKNNLAVLDWLLQSIETKPAQIFEFEVDKLSQDLFLNYRKGA